MFIRCKTIWRVLPVFQHSVYSSTSAVGINPAVPAAAAESSTDNSIAKATEIPAKESTDSEVPKKPTESKKKLVSAAFSSLKEIDSPVYKELELKISSADTVDSLLDVSEVKGITMSHSLKIVSKLADWTTDGKVKLIDFETDPRFTKLCSSLGHNIATRPFKKRSKGEPVVESFSDLGVVLGVAGDDEAAKLVNTITVPQMIKVLSSLAYKKRRSMPLLRSLAFNIGKSSDEINIKDCADILYACAQLSFQDEVLFEKVCSDICKCIKDNKKPAVIGSIVTSLGFIKYKDIELLDLVCEWVMENFSICRIQDLVTLVLTLATVSHIPANGDVLFKKLETHLQKSDVPTPNAWLDVVWALAVLNKATANHVSSVLTEEFIKRLATTQIDGSISTISKLKLLNINGAAKLLIENYNGPFLDIELDNMKVEVPRAKEKLNLITTVLDTLTNLLPSSVYMQTNVNTDMGYIIDGECCVDSSLTPLPLIDKKTLKPIDRSQPGIRKGIKIAILVLDYHDITKGQKDPVGITNLAIQLTQKSGYKVITIPYYDFNPRDKLVTRVQYLEEQLKNVVQNSSSS